MVDEGEIRGVPQRLRGYGSEVTDVMSRDVIIIPRNANLSDNSAKGPGLMSSSLHPYQDEKS